MERFDKLWIGILIGLLLPAAFGIGYIETMHLWTALETLRYGVSGVWSKLLLVSVFPNLAIVFLFYTTESWRLSKGILIGALPYMIASVIVSL